MRTPDTNEISVEPLYQSLRRRALRQGISSYDEYADLVDEIIQEKINAGLIESQDAGLEQLSNDLRSKWRDMEGEIGSQSRLSITP